MSLLPTLLPRQSQSKATNSSSNGTSRNTDLYGECQTWDAWYVNTNNCRDDKSTADIKEDQRNATIMRVCIPVGVILLLCALAWWVRWWAHRRTGHYYPWLNDCWRKGRCQELHGGPLMKDMTARSLSSKRTQYRGSVGYARPVTEVFPGGMREVDAGPYNPGMRPPPAYGSGGLKPAHAAHVRSKSDGEMWYGMGVKDMQLPPRSYDRGSWRGGI